MSQADDNDNTTVVPIKPLAPVDRTAAKRQRTYRRRKRHGAVTVKSPAPVTQTVTATVTVQRTSMANFMAYLAAVSLATVAAYFSVSGMTEIFPGAPTAIIALAATMEGAKLVIAGWLAANWRVTGWLLRTTLVMLVAGLAVLNGAGIYGRLTEAHLGVTAAASSNVAERIGALEARITEQAHTVASIDTQISQIDSAISQAHRQRKRTHGPSYG
jgi:hypothetical protein